MLHNKIDMFSCRSNNPSHRHERRNPNFLFSLACWQDTCVYDSLLSKIIMITYKLTNGGDMPKIIIAIFLVLTLLCSCSDVNKAAKPKPDDTIKPKLDSVYKPKPDDTIKPKLDSVYKPKPDDAIAYSNRGIAYNNRGQYQRAIEEYNEAIRLKPDLAEVYSNRGDCLR